MALKYIYVALLPLKFKWHAIVVLFEMIAAEDEFVRVPFHLGIIKYHHHHHYDRHQIVALYLLFILLFTFFFLLLMVNHFCIDYQSKRQTSQPSQPTACGFNGENLLALTKRKQSLSKIHLL